MSQVALDLSRSRLMLALSSKALEMLSVAARSSVSSFDAELKHHCDDPEKKKTTTRYLLQSDAELASEPEHWVLYMAVSLPPELGILFSGCHRRHSHSSYHSPILSATLPAINRGGMVEVVFFIVSLFYSCREKNRSSVLQSVVNFESLLG